MSQVSPRTHSPRQKNRINEAFFQALGSIKDQKGAEKFFETFFTATEKVNLPKRFGVFLLLIKGEDYDVICENLRLVVQQLPR